MKKAFIASLAVASLVTAFPLMAKTSVEEHGNARVSLTQTNSINVACVQDAVRKRDTAYIDAYNAYNQSIAAALKTRMDAQVSAWAQVSVNDRAVALAVSERAFTSAYNTASLTLTKAKNTIRFTYTKAEQNCRKQGNSSASSVSSTSSSSSVSSSQSSVACSNVTGKLTGAFTVVVTPPDTGRTVNITGTGSVSTVGSVSASGTLHSLGFIATGHATGDITLTQGSSSAVLHLEGPLQIGFSKLPTSFHYTVQSATGVFASLNQTTGNVELQLKGETNGSMKIEFSSRCDR